MLPAQVRDLQSTTSPETTKVALPRGTPPLHLPMQNSAKIISSTSSVVVSPTMSPR